MAESAQQKQTRRWRAVITMTIVLAVLAATAALAATVTQAPTISGDPSAGRRADRRRRSVDAVERDGRPTPGCAATRPASSCAGITGACGREYKVRTADEGHTLRVRLTVTESGGQSALGRLGPDCGRADDAVRDPDRRRRATPARTSRRPGPGKGTFNSGTQTGGGSEPPPGTTLSFIDPFPVIRIAGPLQGQAHDAHARHGQDAAGHAHPDPLQRAAAARSSARRSPRS